MVPISAFKEGWTVVDTADGMAVGIWRQGDRYWLNNATKHWSDIDAITAQAVLYHLTRL